jgi:hypothetical protein
MHVLLGVKPVEIRHPWFLAYLAEQVLGYVLVKFNHAVPSGGRMDRVHGTIVVKPAGILGQDL